MGLSAPRADSLDITALGIVKKWIGINPMCLSTPWAYSLDIIALNPVKKYQRLTQWALVHLGMTLFILFP